MKSSWSSNQDPGTPDKNLDIGNWTQVQEIEKCICGVHHHCINHADSAWVVKRRSSTHLLLSFSSYEYNDCDPELACPEIQDIAQFIIPGQVSKSLTSSYFHSHYLMIIHHIPHVANSAAALTTLNP